MLTTEFVTQVKNDFPKWSRVNILSKLNEVQKIMLFSVPLSQYRILDPTTGKDPVLTTTAGTFNYTLSIASGTFTADTWKAVDIYSNTNCCCQYNHIGYHHPFNSYYKNLVNEQLSMFIDGSSVSFAQVIFHNDPGTTTYHVICYQKPTSLLSESIAITVKDQYHQGIMYEGVCGLIEKSENSGKSDRWEKFEQILLPRFFSLSNSLNINKNVTLRGY